MIIDFHTHVFPDKIAAKTIAALESVADVKAQKEATLSALLESMAQAGVDKSVILPVNTRAGQFDTITKFADAINHTYDNLISFGGIHPDDEDVPGKLKLLKEKGFRGIKLHPDYTETYIDDERYIRIIVEAKRAGLLVVTHAGKDPAYSAIHCPPDKGRRMLDRMQELTPYDEPFIVFAHLGGNRLADDVERYLVGQKCYLDISCSFADIGNFCETTDEQIVRIIKNHGADKVLFATDSPWNDQKEYVERFCSLKGLTDTEKELILGRNAERILHL